MLCRTRLPSPPALRARWDPSRSGTPWSVDSRRPRTGAGAGGRLPQAAATVPLPEPGYCAYTALPGQSRYGKICDISMCSGRRKPKMHTFAPQARQPRYPQAGGSAATAASSTSHTRQRSNWAMAASADGAQHASAQTQLVDREEHNCRQAATFDAAAERWEEEQQPEILQVHSLCTAH